MYAPVAFSPHPGNTGGYGYFADDITPFNNAEQMSDELAIVVGATNADYSQENVVGSQSLATLRPR
jgi:hypothetical protein